MSVPRGNLGIMRRIGNSGDHWGRSPRSDEETMGVGPSGESRDREEDRELGRPLGPVAQIGRGDHGCQSLGGISGLLNSHSLKFRDLTRPSLDPISDARGRPPLLLAGG